MKEEKRLSILCAGVLALAMLIGCGTQNTGVDLSAEETASEKITAPAIMSNTAISDGVYKSNELFTNRDLMQTADLSSAVYYIVSDGQDVHITTEGVYVFRGSAVNVTVYVEAGDLDKVQLVLDGVSITNDHRPGIYAIGADKVFVTTSGDSSLTVTGAFAEDGSANPDGVIFSRADLVLNGTAKLTLTSTDNGAVCKDDLKITGGTYVINAASKALAANDSIRIAGGNFTLSTGTDGLHAENNKDYHLGYVYIGGGEFTITAGDDAIHASSVIQIDDGSFAITAAEGIEGTYVQINGGTFNIQAWGDGINAARKSSAYRPAFEINAGEITIIMASGDTDGIDSNGDIYINGGTINITGSSAFDFDGTAEYRDGVIIVNGQEINSIPS